MRTRTLLILLGAMLTSGCAERTPNQGMVVAPERYSLSAAERATLKEGIDVEALERLIGRLPPEHRAGFRFSKYSPVEGSTHWPPMKFLNLSAISSSLVFRTECVAAGSRGM